MQHGLGRSLVRFGWDRWNLGTWTGPRCDATFWSGGGLQSTLVICGISGIKLPNYMGISIRSISHYKDPRWWFSNHFLFSPLFGQERWKDGG